MYVSQIHIMGMLQKEWIILISILYLSLLCREFNQLKPTSKFENVTELVTI